MTNQLINTAFTAALHDKKMIAGALKHCYITRERADYDDFFQECLLAYVDAYCQYAAMSAPQISRNNYLYTKLCQHIYDYWRKNQCYNKYFSHQCKAEPYADADLTNYLAVQELITHLTSQENQLFDHLYLQSDSVPETCRQLKISHSALYRRRKKLLAKIANFF
ncbi:sigma-70 family RNA polymerase sigma factor [Loigolactobacillus binensis]|uniref:Sigma-70 family RNA polymerase sigma factor n=1 Tax=Loigolactobacillus binensis TaxID=2559922 RepID=A0ABW3EAF8_9LACO|nr:sigma-70 family RNA polymerase sigma factor [Loigolactobacillus binensis]